MLKRSVYAFIEAFNGRFRAECLNAHWFSTLADAAEKLEAWRAYYPRYGHTAFGNKAPIILIMLTKLGNIASLIETCVFRKIRQERWRVRGRTTATQRRRAHEHTETDDMTHPIDKHVGRRIRHGRWMRGTTQHALGDAVKCRFQQIQKYETGANRVSASRLWDIANALDLPITYFFEGKEQPNPMFSTFPDRGLAKLLPIWMSLPDRQKQALLSLAKSMADMDR